jgi:hypothetical protein
MQTKPSSDYKATSPRAPGISSEQRKEIVRRLMVIAEAVGESLTEGRIEIYVNALCYVPYAALMRALARCPTECKWFPKIPELLEMAGVSHDLEAEAEAAWMTLEQFLCRHYHPDLGIHGYESGGRHHPAPKLDARTSLAMRACGGPSRINDSVKDYDENKYCWVKKEFISAWKRAPAVQSHLLCDGQILEKLGPEAKKLLSRSM